MTQPPAGPRCPRCKRPLAAWRLDHCIYCGEPIPADLKEGFAEPEGIQWIERPPLPTDLSKRLELMRILPAEGARPRPIRRMWAIGAGLALPILFILFYLAYRLLSQISGTSATLILLVGIGGVGYLVTSYVRARRK